MVGRSPLGGAAWCAALLSACAGDSGHPAGVRDGGTATTLDGANVDGAHGDGAAIRHPGDEVPTLSAETLAVLRALHYDASHFPPDPSNRFADDPGARAFGQLLFFDASLSGPLLETDNDGNPSTLGKAGETGKVSCAGCHLPSSGFVDSRSPHQQISLAAEWGRRRAPTLLEVGAMPLLDWDGRRDSIWSQAIGVMENPAEFNSGRLFVARQLFLLQRDRYEALFGPMPDLADTARFPAVTSETVGCRQQRDGAGPCRGQPGDGAEYDGMPRDAQDDVTRIVVNAAKAIAAYVRQLRCGQSAFDAWLDGNERSLDPAAIRGAALFVGKARCVECHEGPRLSDGKFHNVGLRPSTVAVAFTDTDDRGAGEALPLLLADPLSSRGSFSDGDRGVVPDAVAPTLEGAFHTPTLRCIAHQPSFMHTGQYRTLRTVVDFFARGGEQLGFPGRNELTPLDLDDAERDDLVAFLAALQGEGPDATLLGPPPSGTAPRP